MLRLLRQVGHCSSLGLLRHKSADFPWIKERVKPLEQTVRRIYTVMLLTGS